MIPPAFGEYYLYRVSEIAFLVKWKSEVIEMCITEYNEERTMQIFLNNGIVLGRVEGKEKGRVDMLF